MLKDFEFVESYLDDGVSPLIFSCIRGGELYLAYLYSTPKRGGVVSQKSCCPLTWLLCKRGSDGFSDLLSNRVTLLEFIKGSDLFLILQNNDCEQEFGVLFEELNVELLPDVGECLDFFGQSVLSRRV